MREPSEHNIFFGPEGLRAGWSLFLFILLFALIVGTFSAIAHAHHPAAHRTAPHDITLRTFFTNESVLLFAIALPTWIMSRIEHRPATAYGLADIRKLPHFLAGLAWGVAFLSLLVLALKFTGLLVFDRRLLFGPAALHYALLWSLGFLLVALFEEGMMRGFLQYTLARGCSALYRLVSATHSQTLGFWTAALLLSILFGLGHRSNPGESPIGLLSAALAALVFCLSLWRTGSLWWAIGFHASWDWAQSFLYGVADSGTMVEHHLFATHPTGSPLLSGGATGPEGSLYILPVLSLAAIIILLTLHRTRLRTDN